MGNRHTMQVAFTVVLVVSGTAWAQFYDPFQAQMAQMDAYIDAWMAQQYDQIQAQQADSMAQFAQIYRQATGDYTTPDHIAAAYGMEIYCQENAAYCAEVHSSWSQVSAGLHQDRMDDIASWGAVNSQIAATNQAILDDMFGGFMDRGAMNSEGHGNMIQGAIHGNGTFYNPNTGAAWQLPIQPDPSYAYTAPTGEPLAFDFNAGVWYVGTNWGWMPLQQGR